MFNTEMHHPFIGSLDELTSEQMSEKISELYRKLGIASRRGDAHVCDQIRLAINTYNARYQQRLKEEMDDNPYNMKIDIT